MQPPARHGKAPRRWRAGVAEQRERGEALLAGGGQGAGGISPHEEAILRLIVGREQQQLEGDGAVAAAAATGRKKVNLPAGTPLLPLFLLPFFL